jgi:hypothetical protein
MAIFTKNFAGWCQFADIANVIFIYLMLRFFFLRCWFCNACYRLCCVWSVSRQLAYQQAGRTLGYFSINHS